MGACHAARALSELLGCRVMVSPPEVRLLSREDLLKSITISAKAAAVAVDTVLGDITGQIVFVLPQEESAGRDLGFTEAVKLEPGTFRLAACLDPDCRFAFCIDSQFMVEGDERNLIGHFIFLPEEESLSAIIQALFGNFGKGFFRVYSG